ncbi:MAG: 4-(cytidine 5'-diphospho)-2-C-methyl-D-erythritol kinase [Candidatus Methanosuratincola sp.]|jgi:4-diphosphocytidyl-2-C-methyl-D-erythritol kinase
MDASEQMTLLAPAKLNLTLSVLGRREDGYHEIRSIMVPISLFDVVALEVERGKGDGVVVETPGLNLARMEDNLAWKAGRLYLDRSALALKVRVRIEKRIPVGGGLGGGSSDAGAVLVGLNRLAGAFSEDTLTEMAASIGADVPFFIRCRPSLVEGIGERITLIRGLPKMYFVLLNPGFPVATRQIYEMYDSMGETLEEASAEEAVRGFKRGSFPLRNDLERAALALYPQIGSLKSLLHGLGAEAVAMSGSGPTVFAAFGEEREAKRVYDYLKDSTTIRVFFAEAVSGWHRY